MISNEFINSKKAAKVTSRIGKLNLNEDEVNINEDEIEYLILEHNFEYLLLSEIPKLKKGKRKNVNKIYDKTLNTCFF
jgi:hypothetical protein